MFEILLLIFVGWKSYTTAEEKGLPGIIFSAAAVVLFFVFEFAGLVIGFIFAGRTIASLCGIYLFSFMAAIFGAFIPLIVLAFWPRWQAPRLNDDVIDPKEFFKKK